MIRAGKTAVVMVGLAWLLVASAAEAAGITYTVDRRIGEGRVTGSITTDGTTGVLGTGNITAWRLTLLGLGQSFALDNTDAGNVVLVQGGALTATTTRLTFDYDQQGNAFLLFQKGLFSGSRYWCEANSSDTCFSGSSVVPASFNDAFAQFEPHRSGLQVIAAVPEPAGLTLLGTALFGLTMVRRRA